jgi:hypothetical protein
MNIIWFLIFSKASKISDQIQLLSRGSGDSERLCFWNNFINNINLFRSIFPTKNCFISEPFFAKPLINCWIYVQFTSGFPKPFSGLEIGF